MTAVGNITGGNIITAGVVSLSGNLSASGNTVLSGNATAATAANGTNTTQIANTAWVRSVIQDKSEQAAYWQGSRKFVSTADPTPANGDNGDFWFKYQ
jgi:predicted lipoprotein